MAGGGHVATRLGQQAVKYNLFHSYQAFNTCYTDTGLWGAYLITDRMRIDDAMSALQDEWYGIHHVSGALLSFDCSGVVSPPLAQISKWSERRIF